MQFIFSYKRREHTINVFSLNCVLMLLYFPIKVDCCLMIILNINDLNRWKYSQIIICKVRIKLSIILISSLLFQFSCKIIKFVHDTNVAVCTQLATEAFGSAFHMFDSLRCRFGRRNRLSLVLRWYNAIPYLSVLVSCAFLFYSNNEKRIWVNWQYLLVFSLYYLISFFLYKQSDWINFSEIRNYAVNI